MHPPRFPVLQDNLNVPRKDEFLKRIHAFALKIKRNLDPEFGDLNYKQKERVRKLAEQAHHRRLEAAGLAKIKDEERQPLVDLAREGARLMGPVTRHQVDELAAEIHAGAPWMAELTTRLMKHMRATVRSGQPGLSMPPLLLVGKPGNGKSWYARKIGDLVGAPVREIDVGSGSAAFRVTGLEKGWSSATPGLPVETVLQSRIGNPVIVVNEICKAAQSISSTKGSVASLVTALLQMLERDTASRFECPGLRVRFDMSRVCWILTANDLDQVAAPLKDRCLIFRMPEVSPDIAALMFDTLSRKHESHTNPEALDFARQAVIEAAARGHVSLRQIQRVLDRLAADEPEILH